MAKAYSWKRDGDTVTLTLNAGSSSAFNTCYTQASLLAALNTLATVRRDKSKHVSEKAHAEKALTETAAMYREGMELFK